MMMFYLIKEMLKNITALHYKKYPTVLAAAANISSYYYSLMLQKMFC
jgi:hypothetical protein